MRKTISIACIIAYGLLSAAVPTSARATSRFTSHVTVNTPSRSYSHGVGRPVPIEKLESLHRSRQNHRSFRGSSSRGHGDGYPRMVPSIPFYQEEVMHENTLSASPWQYDYYDTPIPLLPPSPYEVDSPNPESLWPEGLFLPPLAPRPFSTAAHRSDDGEVLSEEPLDPYLLEDTEAKAAVKRATLHGELYFHNIPHIESLLANQELRSKNDLKPLRIASIRHTWPFNRP